MPRTSKKKTTENVAAEAAENPVEDIVTDPEPVAEEVKDEVSTETTEKKTKKKKRTFKLHNFRPEDGRGPKNGGSYKSPSPQLAAKKAASRWVVPKDKYNEVYTFFLREVNPKNKEKSIYQFKAKRVKLKNPKSFTRGEKTLTVDSRIEIVS